MTSRFGEFSRPSGVGGARSSILAALRTRDASSEAPEAPPEIIGSWLRTADADEQRRLFARMLEAAGGSCVTVASDGELATALAATPAFATAERRVSLVPDAGDPTVNIGAISQPGDLADIDFALLPGVFGVAENGAVWIEGESLTPRSVLVLPEHLGIVVPYVLLAKVDSKDTETVINALIDVRDLHHWTKVLYRHSCSADRFYSLTMNRPQRYIRSAIAVG